MLESTSIKGQLLKTFVSRYYVKGYKGTLNGFSRDIYTVECSLSYLATTILSSVSESTYLVSCRKARIM